MIRLVKNNASSYTIEECSSKILNIQRIISNELNVFEWNVQSNSKIFIGEIDKVQEILISQFIDDAKEYDRMVVDKTYKNSFGNSCYFVANKKPPFSVNYNFGVEKSGVYSDVFYIENFNFDNIEEEKMFNLFMKLIETFRPTHATITHSDLVDEIIDFKSGEIWTGWVTFISNDLNIDVPSRYKYLNLDYGKVIFSSEELQFDINNSDNIKEIIGLTEYLRKVKG
ncbi:hypothetical protein [Snuella sedimenti]|uniref:Immunity protein 52 domain-containing protein n=1 Tax=Snuella sedimenti TaxID=2798802 RepID=A0A8J7IKQ7_9FLAO|nr:hypothetical protein [Snuella sedimenti]MBJ6369886.1 hypothetical protein [Snuella sedimenti]